ncbi:MAG TPA: hypothetical protein VGD74_02715 [Vulgatibacter sp.]
MRARAAVVAIGLTLAGLGIASDARADDDPDADHTLPFYVPSQAKLQFAGNVGLLAVGGGWTWFHRTLDLDLLYGWVPPLQGDESIHIGTLKVTVWPIEIDLGDDWLLRPLSAGGVASLTFGDDYWIVQPDRYPDDYYPFSTALRFGAFVGGSFGRRFPHSTVKHLDVYWEAGVTDIELWLFLENPHHLTFWDVLHVALGVSVGFES